MTKAIATMIVMLLPLLSGCASHKPVTSEAHEFVTPSCIEHITFLGSCEPVPNSTSECTVKSLIKYHCVSVKPQDNSALDSHQIPVSIQK